MTWRPTTTGTPTATAFLGYELERGDYVVELKRDAHTLAPCPAAQTTLYLPQDVACEKDLKTGTVVGQPLYRGGRGGRRLGRRERLRGGHRLPHARRLCRDLPLACATRTAGWRRAWPRLNLYGEERAHDDARRVAEASGPSEAQPSVTAWSQTWRLFSDGELTELGRELGEGLREPLLGRLFSTRLSVADMESLALHGYLATGAIDAIGKPFTKEVDGPAQVGSFNQLTYGVGYPAPSVLAQTWNADLAREYGRRLGLEAAVLGVDGLYAPCANLHRTPLGGA